MVKMPSNLSDWKARLKAELGRDKKKTAILAVLLAVAGVIGGRLVVTHSLPGRASAETPAPRGGEDHTLTPPPRPAPLPTWTGAGNPRAQVRREEYVARMDRSITRDLFKANLTYFPLRLGDGGLQTGSGGSVAGWLGTIYQRVLRKQQADIEELSRIRAIRTHAQSLSLQSTMLGSSPTALINGQVLREGECVSGFRLKRIAWDCCTVSRDGVDVELRMD